MSDELSPEKKGKPVDDELTDQILREWTQEDEDAADQIEGLLWGEHVYLAMARKRSDSDRTFRHAEVATRFGDQSDLYRDKLVARKLIAPLGDGRYQFGFKAFELAQKLVEDADRYGATVVNRAFAQPVNRSPSVQEVMRMITQLDAEAKVASEESSESPQPSKKSLWMRAREVWEYIGRHGVLYTLLVIIIGAVLWRLGCDINKGQRVPDGPGATKGR